MQKMSLSQWGNSKRALSTLPKLNRHKRFLPRVPVIGNMGYGKTHVETLSLIYPKKDSTKHLKLRRESKTAELHYPFDIFDCY